MVFFRDVAAPFLNNGLVKAAILFIFLLYLGITIWGVFRLKEGLERKKLGKEIIRRLCFFVRVCVSKYTT
jgi:hypothetical protein